MRNHHTTALNCRRRSGIGPRSPTGRWGSIKAHSSFVRSPRAMLDALPGPHGTVQTNPQPHDLNTEQTLVAAGLLFLAEGSGVTAVTFDPNSSGLALVPGLAVVGLGRGLCTLLP